MRHSHPAHARVPRRSWSNSTIFAAVALAAAFADPTLGQVTLNMPAPPAPRATSGEDGGVTVGDVALSRFASARSGPRGYDWGPGGYRDARSGYGHPWHGDGYGRSWYGYGNRWPWVVSCGRVGGFHRAHTGRSFVRSPGSFTHVAGFPRPGRIRHGANLSQ